MFGKLCAVAAGLLLTANVSLAAQTSETDRKDFQVAKDIARTVQRYSQVHDLRRCEREREGRDGHAHGQSDDALQAR